MELQFAQIVQQTYRGEVPQWREPPRKPRWGRWIGITIAVLTVLCLGSVALAGRMSPWLLSLRSATPMVSASATPTSVRTPQPGDSQQVYAAWAVAKVRETLVRQRDALLAGDESSYLRAADPTMSKAVHDSIVREFHSLRAMQVADVRDEVGAPIKEGTDTWNINLRTTVCFVVKGCADGPALAETIWRVQEATATLVSWVPDHENQPWQVSELVASAGQRTVVATTKAYAAKLPMLVQEAEKAAKVADRFARDGKVPSRYVIYYAATAEWKQWFGANPPEWSGGIAIDVGKDRYDLMLNADQLYRTAIDDLLRHEMTHAATLPGEHSGRSQWWLVEGIAEYALMDGLPASSHQGAASARSLIDAGKITNVEVSGPEFDSADEEVMGRYAVAFLGVRCLAERFGEAKLVDFFHRVVQDQATLAMASTQVYGVDWTSLRGDCFGYVKQTLG